MRARAVTFAARWKDESSEKSESQTFWTEFLDIYGVDRKRVAAFEQLAKRTSTGNYGFIDLYWPGVLIAEQKSAGKDLVEAEKQALDYLYFRANDNGVGKLWRISDQGEIESKVLPGTNPFIGCQCDRAITVLNGRLFMVLYSDETGSEFAYLDEPTFVLPPTNRDGSVWITALVLLAVVTAAAGLTVRVREVKRA